MAKVSLINQYSKEELCIIIQQVTNWSDLMRALGYVSSSGDQLIAVKKRIETDNLDVSHFVSVKNKKTIRTKENVFIENSTADQKTLKRFFHQEDVPYVCAICGQQPVWQNKKLTLILDHKNGKNHDNRLENLQWVCPNCNMQLPTTNRAKSALDEKSQKKHYCIDCGREVTSPSSNRCKDCAIKERKQQAQHNKPISRSELKKLIRTTPFTQIGKMFQVSDNAIRKWCETFGLPKKVSDIKQYSDEEWEQI